MANQTISEFLADLQDVKKTLDQNAPPKKGSLQDPNKYPYKQKFVTGEGDTTEAPITHSQYVSALGKAQEEHYERVDEKNKPPEQNYTQKMPDGTIIKAETLKKLEEEIKAYKTMTTPPKVDEAEKRKNWIKEYSGLEAEKSKLIDVVDESDSTKTKKDFLYSNDQLGMMNQQQTALQDSVNYSYGREAQKSQQNWTNFLKQTGLQDEANRKYEQFLGEVKLGKHGKAFAPGQEEGMATELTDQYINKILKEKYGIEQ